ncbi:MAG: hypothetical protein HZB95_06695 [Nitrosomonadales bacterium]|nr:hypothetical protein [Nitrosomonadales bacterium]
MARASNFTDAQKAQLYVLHLATCVYSGDKLWILDGGATPYFTIDWADHIIPVAKGGLSTLENGVCASWYHNKEKSDKTEVPPFLFFKGKATKHYYKFNKSLPRKMASDLSRFGNLHHSDWYFNRALFRMLLGVDYLHNGVGIRTRDNVYYAGATLKAITKWRRIVTKESVATLEERGIAPATPSPDQKLMLKIRNVTTVDDILTTMKKLLPAYAKAARM